MTDTMDPATETMNGTMKAVSQDELGGPDVLKLVTVPTPEPGISEILIRVHAAGVNPIDGAQRQTGAFVGQPPFVLGWDLCGAVEAVGPGVTLYQPGDVVFGMLPFPQGHGAYAQYAVGPTRVFVRKPDRLDHVHAAAIPMVGLTAWQALVDTAGVGAGSRVLINGAAGGIGHLAGPAGDGCEEGLVHFALARRGASTVHQVEHFGAVGRGAVRVKSLKVMLNMLEQALGTD